MFVGHYGPAAAAAGGRIKLWHAVVAVQLLDIAFAPLLLTGVEKMRIVEGFTASNHFDLHHMPYTHSLVAAIVWSIVAGLVYPQLNRRAGVAGGMIIGALVFSHWALDYLMHKPDLPLWFGGPKVGLGLWDNRPLSVTLELSVFLVGMIIYSWRTAPIGRLGKVSLILFLAVGVILQIYGNWAPPSSSVEAFAISALAAYGVFTLLAMFVDSTRTIKGAP